jgi:glutathione synthase
MKSTSSFFFFSMLIITTTLVFKTTSFSRTISKMKDLAFPRYYRKQMAMSSSNGLKSDTDQFIKQADAWCAINGLLYSDGEKGFNMAPVALIPNTFSNSSYEYAQNVQPIINTLIDKISRDKDFLFEHLSPVATADTFVARLLDIYGQLPDEIIKEQVQVGLHRSDYMINVDENGKESPLQVEMNTIASSFGCLSKKVGDLHKFLLTRNSDSIIYQNLLKDISEGQFSEDLNLEKTAKLIPNNRSVKMLAFGLAMAHFVFGDTKAHILFIVQPGEKNVADQRLLEQELWTSHGVRVDFMTLAQVNSVGLIGKDNSLYISGSNSNSNSGEEDDRVLVSVVYYRAGYTPNDYPSEKEWAAREMIEKSASTKCPSIGYQLAGTKKIQQVLCEDGNLEKYVSNKDALMLKKCFAAQYSLAPLLSIVNTETIAAIEKASKDGSKWVLKPQREGGGNNLYGKELSDFLVKNINDPLLSGYVLMQRIFPKPQKTAFLRKGELTIMPSISELGIYGVFLGDGSSTPLLNDCAGYLLRTKQDGVDEGGVASGFSVLNSIILIDDKSDINDGFDEGSDEPRGQDEENQDDQDMLMMNYINQKN